jgi:uracil-DNA glycosylase
VTRVARRPLARQRESTAAAYLPARLTLPDVREAARGCRACPLWQTGTQTVFGEGGPSARIVLVGEEPGHEEDLAGRPFVGPAGRVLDRALQGAGIAREETYVTNVVKHFKWEPRGKRRLHKRPAQPEIRACLPWLQAELALVEPEVVVCLGATAAQTLLGRSFKVTEHRGRVVASLLGPRAVATMHPSSILRAPDAQSRARELQALIADLKVVADLIRRD